MIFGPLDDYELGLAVAHAGGTQSPHLVDPVLVEHVGSTMRPPLTALAASLTNMLAAFAALPEDVRAILTTAAEGQSEHVPDQRTGCPGPPPPQDTA